ncbi:MAG: cell division protein FtsA [Bacillota bacterium]
MESIFVLDIGTRTVMGLIASLEDGKLSVSHLIYKEHKTRSMLDGQIHNVEQVTQIVKEIVQEIRSLSGLELKKVAVAAAGRALRTVRGTAKVKFPLGTVITREDVLSLELQAVQDAQLALPKNQGYIPLSQQYYCVGYSVVEQHLDNITIGSLVGQRGQDADLQVVATFLPRIVVDSLQTVVEQAGLELFSITLEPIAVANLVLNPTMRRLNLVLVDIGAGTSDIAVCGDNTVSAFGMVPMAGDEITEAICDAYLLDFNVGEQVKRNLTDENITVTDVLGIEQNLKKSEVLTTLVPAVDSLAEAIAQEIYGLNGKTPQAVLIVGGGSLTPGLTRSLAEKLQLPENRVAVQQAGKLNNVLNLPPYSLGPNFITVLGIAYTGLTCPTMGFVSVNINDIPVRLLNIGKNTVAEALLAGGFNLRDLYGRPGMALTFEINGQMVSIPGKMGTPGSITLNGEPAQLNNTVRQGDKIIFTPGKPGEEAKATYGEVLKDYFGFCRVNGKNVEIKPVVKTGNKIISLEDNIVDGSKAEVVTKQTVKDVLAEAGFLGGSTEVTVNGKVLSLLDMSLCTINGKKAKLDDQVAPGDHIYFEPVKNLTVDNFLPGTVTKGTALQVYVNGKKVALQQGEKIWVNKNPAERTTPVQPGDEIDYQFCDKKFRPILIDIFNKINFSPNPPPGKTRLLLLVNNEEKEYTYPLQDGDKIEISWT